MSEKILKSVNDYYTHKVQKFGATSKGVDWNGKESHFIRFEQLSKIFDNESTSFSLLDYGCGFGSLIEFLDKHKVSCKYTGFDISEEMIRNAKELFDGSEYKFTTSLKENETYDYIIANGIFNVKLKSTNANWKNYIIDTIKELDKKSNKGFSFNVLTKYSDKEYMKDYLYYADPLFFFDYCKQHFSRNVALLHDYDLYEFTLLIKK